MPAAPRKSPLAWILNSRLRFVALAVALAALSGCNSVGVGGSTDEGAMPTPPVASSPLPGTQAGAPGDAFGVGPVRVGMVLPLTQNGAPSAIGQALRNAAKLAVDESGSNDITVVVEDDRSTADGAAQAAKAELDNGAQILLGPLYAANVRAVAPLAKAANRPIIAFSTDISAASSGVYLLSFMIESYVDRIFEYASSKGKTSIAILAPQNDYANVAVAQAQIEAAKLHLSLVVVSRYSPGQPASAAQEIAAAAPGGVDALFIPEQADGMAAVTAALASAQVKAQLLGTGVWNDPRVLKLPGLQGAWFSSPEGSGFNAFATRYHAKFKSEPPRLATLAYDAVSLVAALARAQPGAAKFSDATLTSSSGFNGADGLFRFHADGGNDRGLAVMQVNNGAASVISPAPRTFSGG